MTDVRAGPGAGRASAFEWWMLANFAMGAGFSAFIALLIPPYVNQVTGDVAASGVVMAVISLAAVLGPVLGTFADSYRAHRLVMCGGVLGMAGGFAAFAISSEAAAFYALDAIILGISVAAISAVGPVFIVGAGLSREVESRRMTLYSLAMPAGQVIGGLAISAAARAEWSFSDRFWLASAFTAVLFVVVWFTSKAPERRIHAAMDTQARAAHDRRAEGRVTVRLKAVLWSSFGAFLLVHALSSLANNGVNNQISNILPNVYGISESGTSTLIAVAGLVNIVLFLPAGRWMSRSGAFTVYNTGNVLRLIGALGMALVGWLSGQAIILAIAFIQILYQGNPFSRLAQPGSAVGFARFPAGAANGWLIAAAALGSFGGSALGGVVAESYGFNAINWMAAAAAGLSITISVVLLMPAVRRGEHVREAEPVPGAAAKAAAA